MLPKIKKTLPLEESLVLEDHLNDLTYGFRNQNYRKLKIKHMPKPIDTPFGNFPKEYCTKSMIKEEPRHQSIFTKEKEEFPTSKKRMASEPSLFKKPFLKLPKIQSSLPKCGAFLPREITFSEFRRQLLKILHLFFKNYILESMIEVNSHSK